ncbi:PAS domain-containing protein [Cysteiniphilum sp. QT6929]|uniref:PAS domain-containing sensor histidine kinase n=1 Tax=Cysteiniphilum sp. QT6929 TaxID=2975055 RepID=UPI0024B340FE|nr:PAS domain-containing protein [Cysteiniphilum sp. QT6929]WHN66772.1 PAS domain-containing protein [Cysteiniphilum sp. QT6929]
MSLANNQIQPSFTEFAEMVPEPIYWGDLNQRVIGFNEIGIHAAGAKSKDELIGKNPFEYYPEDIARKIVSDHKDVIANGEKKRFEETIEDITTGNTKVFDATIAPWRNDKGEIIGTVGISIDITERKRLEEETVRQKNQLEKKLQFQKGYLKSFGYDAVNSLKTISDAIDKIEKRLMQLDVPHKVRDDLNDEFYDINESLSQMYTIYQEINSTVIAEEEKIKDFDKKHEIPTHLENLVEAEMDIANGSISAEFDVEATFEMDETSKQKVNVDYKKLQHIIRTLLANYTKAIDKDSRKEDIHLKITAKDGANDKLYVTFNFAGNIPFLELEEDNIRAEHLMYKNQTHIAMDKHNFAYDLALARHYADMLCEGEDDDLNESLFESPRFSFTLPFQKATGDGKEKKFNPTLVE